MEKLPLDDLETTLEPLLLSWKAAGGRRSFGDHIEKLGDQEVSALLTATAKTATAAPFRQAQS